MSRSSILFLLFVCSLVPSLAAEPALIDNPSLMAIDGTPLALRTADVDADGKLDFAILIRDYTNSSLVRVMVYRGAGGGTFQAPVLSTLTTGSTAFDVARLDGDTFPDLVAMRATNNGPALQTYRGLGDGSFSLMGSELVAPSCPNGTVTLADMTGDGANDVTCALTVFPNLGTGTFGPAVTQVPPSTSNERSLVLDANGDGKRDVLTIGSYATLHPGIGDGTFQPGTIVDYEARGAVAMADFNGNGRADLAVVEEGLFVTLATNAGGWGDRAGHGFAEAAALTAADVNGDGRPDLVGSGQHQLSIWIMDANGVPARRSVWAAGTAASMHATGDFDGDGAVDVLTADTMQGVHFRTLVALVRGAGDGTLRSSRAYAGSTQTQWGQFRGDGPSGAAVADVTGDGKGDLVTIAANAPAIAVFAGRGDGTFEDGPQYTALPQTGGAHPLFGDLDEDGILDVIAPGSDTFTVFVANGDGTFTRTAQWFGYSYHKPTHGLGDFNGDGHLDFVNGTSMHPGGGNGTFGDPITSGFSVSADTFSIGDVNGDGRDDVVFANAVLLGTASGLFTKVDMPLLAFDAMAALVDLDGDGKLDLVNDHDGPGSNQRRTVVMRGNGDGTFGAGRSLLRDDPDAFWLGIPCTGDFNGDGHADVAIGPVVLAGDGAGFFGGYARLRDVERSTPCGTGDADGNGSDDLLFSSREGHAVSVVRTRTAESLALPLTLAIETAPVSAPAASTFGVTARATGLGPLVPTGAVVFSIDGQVVAMGELVNGVASGIVSGTRLGSQSLTAHFTGDDVYAAADAAPRQVEITRATTSFSSTVFPGTNVTTRDHVIFTGMVNSNLPGITGTVTLYVDGVARETQPAPRYEFHVGRLAEGRRQLRLAYSGDETHLPLTPSISALVNVVKPEIVMTVATNVSSGVPFGTAVTVTVTFPNDPELTGTVNIRGADNVNRPVPISGGVATLTTDTLPPGQSVGAQFPGDATYRATTKWIFFTITDAPAVPGPASFYLVTPCRVMDTRDYIGGYIHREGERDLHVSGKCGIPYGAKAVAMNVTVVRPDGDGYVTVFPGAGTRPFTSTMNYRKGRTRANNAVLPLSAGGMVKLFNSGPERVDVIVDVTGYFQ